MSGNRVRRKRSRMSISSSVCNSVMTRMDGVGGTLLTVVGAEKLGSTLTEVVCKVVLFEGGAVRGVREGIGLR